MKHISILFCIILSIHVNAQKKNFTIKQAVTADAGKLIPKGLDQLKWLKNSNSFSQINIKDNQEVLQITEIDLKKLSHSIFISKSEFNQQFKSFFPDKDTFKKFPNGSWISNQDFKFFAHGNYYIYNYKNKSFTKDISIDFETMDNIDIAPISNLRAWTEGDDLIVENKKMPRENKKGIVLGKAVHRNEFGIEKGTFWSNNGTSLAYYYMDESMVTEYPVYNLQPYPAQSNMLRYPTSGAKSHHVKLMIYHTSTSSHVEIKTGTPEEQYLTNITWSPDDKFVFIAIVNRAQNQMWLNQYDANTGAFVKTLFTESNSKYVEPENGLMFLNTKNDHFIWQSERDGYNHLYLFNTKGEILQQLTKGNWIVTEIVGLDAKDLNLYYMATAESPTERHLYQYNFKTKKTLKITNGKGTHRVMPNSDYSAFINYFQNTTTPLEIKLISNTGKNIHLLHTAINPLDEYNLGEITLGTLKNKDGIDLHYRLIKPINFDANKKYPVIVYLYNGPHLQLVNNTWLGGANLWMQYMAQKGFIVFSLDGRGSANRGFDFESSIHRQLGKLEMEDQLVGVEYLKSLNYVDASRMGIHGWSYGGFMTTTIMTKSPKTFKVGVAGGPVIDWSLYEIMYTERYMDTPEENPEGYKANNLLSLVDKLEGKLMIIHGAEDDVVLWQHSLLYLQEAIKKNVQLDYFVYPHHKHNVSGIDRVHLMEKISNYFIEHL